MIWTTLYCYFEDTGHNFLLTEDSFNAYIASADKHADNTKGI